MKRLDKGRRGEFGCLGLEVSCGKATKKCMVNRSCLVKFVIQIRVVVFLVHERGTPLQRDI